MIGGKFNWLTLIFNGRIAIRVIEPSDSASVIITIIIIIK
jgi:hypothetical protein